MKNEIHVSTWEECEDQIHRVEKVNGTSRGIGLCFRGQSNAEWALETTLERRTNHDYLIIDYLSLISGIKSEIETFTGAEWIIPSLGELEQWCRTYEVFQTQAPPGYDYIAHLRHHGFPSPLLDWSRSPYVAAYFAFANAQASHVAIFIFCERPNNMKVGSSDEPYIAGLGPLVRTHKRHFLQQSVYTMCGRFDPAIGWRFARHHGVFALGRYNQDLLLKIVIPASERLKVLKLLDRFNLNRYSLFGSEESLMETLAFRRLDLNPATR